MLPGNQQPHEAEVSIFDKDEDKDYTDPLGEDTYYGLDYDAWDRRPGEREKDVSLPAKLKAEFDDTVPLIVEVPDAVSNHRDRLVLVVVQLQQTLLGKFSYDST